MKRLLILAAFALVLTPAAAQDSKLERAFKKARKAETKKVGATLNKWFKARQLKNLVKPASNGELLWPGARRTDPNTGKDTATFVLNTKGILKAFLGFHTPGLTKPMGSDERKAWFTKEIIGEKKRRPNWNLDPLAVQSHGSHYIQIHRDCVTITSQVTYDSPEKESKGLRTVWVRRGKNKYFLSARAYPKMVSGKDPYSHYLGPCDGDTLLPVEDEALSASRLAMEIEAAYLSSETNEDRQALVKGKAVSDYGTLVKVIEDPRGNIAIVRSGYLLVHVWLSEEGADNGALVNDQAAKQGTKGVYFSGTVRTVNFDTGWGQTTYECLGSVNKSDFVGAQINGSLRELHDYERP